MRDDDSMAADPRPNSQFLLIFITAGERETGERVVHYIRELAGTNGGECTRAEDAGR